MSTFKEYIPNMIDKQLLVWYKKYPSKSAIPPSVNESMMKKVHNRARVHGSLMLMGAFVFAFIGVAFMGKRAAQRGESLTTMNEDFHREYNLKHK